MPTQFSFNQTNGNVVSVKDYGAVGDGVTDDTAALKACFAAMGSSNWRVEFEAGKTYLFNTDVQYGINMNAVSNFIIEGNGATIKVKDNAASTGIADLVIFWMEDCTDGLIQNLTLNGNRANRTYTADSGAHNLHIRNNCTDLKFKNFKAINGANDCVYVDTSATPAADSDVPTDILFEDCTMLDANRNALSVIDSLRCKIIGGSYACTVGTASTLQAGIDFEDNAGSSYGNKEPVVDGVRFEDGDNKGLQISGSAGVIGGVFRNLVFKENGKTNNDGASLIVAKCQDTKIHDVMFYEHTGAVLRGIFDIGASAATGLEVNNITFVDANPTGAAQNYCLYDNGASTDLVIGNVNIFGTNSIGVYLGSHDTELNGLTVHDSTAGAPLSVAGDRIESKNIKTYNTASKCIVATTAADSVVDGFYSVDCSDTTSVITFIAADGVLRNARAVQTTSIPVGQTAFRFSAAPQEVSSVSAKSAGTDYEGSNVVAFPGGLASDTILNAITPGFWTNSRVSSDQGDASVTLTRGTSERIQLWSTPLTTGRTVTLSTTGAKNGDEFKIIRDASATGASNLDVGGLKNLAAGEWCEVTFISGAWILSQYGSL